MPARSWAAQLGAAMPSIKFNGDELDALAGLPHLSIMLYMLGLRPRMNYASGYVGLKPLISWQALRESIYIEPHPGIKHKYASADALQRAAGWLEKAGLIKLKSRDRQLIFSMLLADTDKSVKNKAARGPLDQAARGRTDQDPHKQGLSGESDSLSRQTKIPQAAIHPVNGKHVNTSSSPNELTGAKIGLAGEEGEDFDFIFPSTMSRQQRAAIQSKLGGMTQGSGQAVIDELAGCIQAGGVKSVAGLLRYFIEQAKTGQFMPDKGEKIRQARATRQAENDASGRGLGPAYVKGAGKPANLVALVKKRGDQNV